MSINPQHVMLPFFIFYILFSFTTCEETFKVGVVRDKFLTYAASDTLIYNGIVYWRDWVNNRGGLYYNGSAKQVEVLAIDSSTPDPSQVVPYVTAAYKSLVNDNKVNLIVSPFSGDRTSAAINVSETYKIINFVPASFLDFQFRSNNSYIFNDAIPSPKIAPGCLKVLVAKGAKTYVMLRRPDSVSVLIGNLAIKYLAANGVQQLSVVWANETSNQADKFISNLRGALMSVKEITEGLDFDIFVYAGLSTEFSSIAPVFAQLAPKAKSAALILPTSRYQQASDQLGNVGDYWVSSTRFDRDFSMGDSGQLGGTTSEFVADFSDKFGFPPSSFDAITAALLMSYYAAVNLTQSINSSVVRETLKSMEKLQTFACPIDYFQNGTNRFSQLVAMQFVNGEGRLLTSNDVIYPAPFHEKQKSVSVKLIMAVVVPTAAAIIAAVVLGMTYVRRQHAQVVKALVQAEEGERRNYKIDYSSVTIGSPIGCGGFGIVFKGEYRGADVAIKKLKSQNMNKAELAEFAKESAIMIGLRHPNILLFMGVCLEPASLCIITEFMPRGSMHDIIHNDKLKLPFPLVKSMALDILKGLQFIHSAGIIHRDLKSPNLLVDRNWGIKIADFGLSAAKAKLDDDVQISLLWTAPEVLTLEPNCYSEKSDIYSFAIVLWELLARKTPYTYLMACAIAPAVVKGHRPALDEKWDETFSTLISKCWAHSPVDRPPVKDARILAEQAHADPGFEIGGSSSLLAFIDKAKPPADKVTFIYTSVSHSAELWEHDPHVMRRSLLLHNKILRDFMVIHYGYEVKYNADSFLIAFGDPIKAVIFTLAVQNALLHAPWDDVLLRHPEAAEKRDSNGTVIFRGLSVCMGIHTTPTVHTRDAATGRMEYFSDEMGFAATFAAHAAKGWLCMGPDLYTCVMSNSDKFSQFTIESKGIQIVCGKELNLYQMTLAALKERDKSKSVVVVPSTPTGDDDSPTFQFPAGAEKWRIQFESIGLKEKIGAGSFGEVRLGNYKGRKIAVKQILKQKLTDDALLELYVESTILSSLNHPNILEFCGMCLNLPNVCMVTEYMEKGNLAQLIHTTPCVLTWDQRMRMARDMAQGMAYLHSKNVIHRDIKPTNMLVGTDLTVKIGDFGFSRMKADNQTMTQVGTVAYSAPEVFEGLRYTDKADVYSFGILLWELVTCKKPWEKTHSLKIVAAVTSGQRPPVSNLPSGAPSKLVSTLQECWGQVPDNRPSFAQIVVKLS